MLNPLSSPAFLAYAEAAESALQAQELIIKVEMEKVKGKKAEFFTEE